MKADLITLFANHTPAVVTALFSRDPFSGLTKPVFSPYWIYTIEGEECVVSDKAISSIEKRASEVLQRDVKLESFVVPGYEAQKQIAFTEADALDIQRLCD